MKPRARTRGRRTSGRSRTRVAAIARSGSGSPTSPPRARFRTRCSSSAIAPCRRGGRARRTRPRRRPRCGPLPTPPSGARAWLRSRRRAADPGRPSHHRGGSGRRAPPSSPRGRSCVGPARSAGVALTPHRHHGAPGLPTLPPALPAGTRPRFPRATPLRSPPMRRPRPHRSPTPWRRASTRSRRGRSPTGCSEQVDAASFGATLPRAGGGVARLRRAPASPGDLREARQGRRSRAPLPRRRLRLARGGPARGDFARGPLRPRPRGRRAARRDAPRVDRSPRPLARWERRRHRLQRGPHVVRGASCLPARRLYPRGARALPGDQGGARGHRVPRGEER